MSDEREISRDLSEAFGLNNPLGQATWIAEVIGPQPEEGRALIWYLSGRLPNVLLDFYVSRAGFPSYDWTNEKADNDALRPVDPCASGCSDPETHAEGGHDQ